MIKIVKNQIEKHPRLWEIFKFLLVGGTATIIDFLIMGLVIYIWKPPFAEVIGTGLGFTAGLIFNYILSIIFVYTGKNNSSARAKTFLGAVLFAILSLIGLCIHLVGMYVGFDLLGINEWAIKVTLTIVILAFNYVTRKMIIFKKRDKTSISSSTAEPTSTEPTL